MKWTVTVIKGGSISAREEFTYKRDAVAFLTASGKAKYICKVRRNYVTHLLKS